MNVVFDVLPLFVALALVAFGAALALVEGKRASSAKSWSDFQGGDR